MNWVCKLINIGFNTIYDDHKKFKLATFKNKDFTEYLTRKYIQLFENIDLFQVWGKSIKYMGKTINTINTLFSNYKQILQ